MIRTDRVDLIVFYAFGLVLVTTGLIAIVTEQYLWTIIAPALLFVYVSINDLRLVYVLLWFLIPLSTEVALPNNFSTDFPSELLIGGLMLLFIPAVATRPQVLPSGFVGHPIIVLIILYYFYLVFGIPFSTDQWLTTKFVLAKTWYLVTFVFVTAALIRSEQELKKPFLFFMASLLFTAVYVLWGHAQYNFAFAAVNKPVGPFYRNHVDYACVLAQALPFMFLATTWFSPPSWRRRLIVLGIAITLVGIIFAYTRSAWVALVAAAAGYVLLRLRWLPWAVVIAFIAGIAFFVYLGMQGRFYRFEPNFEQTIYHAKLEDHLASTFEGKDVSSAERVYRWIAGVRIWLEHPIMGVGPNNFYNTYKSHTISSFRTWVSENVEKSTVHNYFLLVLAEQGIIGFLFFSAITLWLFFLAQRVYNASQSVADRRYAAAITLCLIIIYTNNLFSDLIETDSVGSFYFICIALLINQQLRLQRLQESSA